MYETILYAQPTSCTFLCNFNFYARHSFHLGIYLRINVREYLPKATTVTAITDCKEFSLRTDSKPCFIDFIPPN
jgi:hypothetical protein